MPATKGIVYLYYTLIKNISDEQLLYKYYLNPATKSNNLFLMKITQMLKNKPDIMKDVNHLIYKAFSDDLYLHVIKNHYDSSIKTDAAVGIDNAAITAADSATNAFSVVTTNKIDILTNGASDADNNPLSHTNSIKSFCDLILFDILCRMNFKNFDTNICDNNIDLIQSIIKPEMNTQYNTNDINIIDDGKITQIKRNNFLEKNKEGINKINNYINDFNIPMDKKIILYQILNFLIKDDIIDITEPNAKKINILFDFIIHKDHGCAPRTIIQGYVDGGYNNKSGDIDYHICKANFKQTFKKVSAKSSREAAKMVAMKVLKDKKKSAKFSLKRMIGKKEKCYDYDVSIDKSGKIIIKNQ